MEIRKVETAFEDDRGSIADIFYKQKIDHVAIIKTNSGNFIRGNHYHKYTTQHIFMTKGKLRYWYKDSKDKSNQPPKSILVDEGYVVSTPPREVHALEMLDKSEFIVFSSGIRGGMDYESDTFRDIVILTPEMLESNG